MSNCIQNSRIIFKIHTSSSCMCRVDNPHSLSHASVDSEREFIINKTCEIIRCFNVCHLLFHCIYSANIIYFSLITFLYFITQMRICQKYLKNVKG